MSKNTGACGHAANSNGNCFHAGCWNHNSKRHDDGRGGPVDPIVPVPKPDSGRSYLPPKTDD